MQKLLLGTALSLVMAGAASAADLGVYKASPWTWTGFYVGAHAGGGWFDSSFVSNNEAASGLGAVAGGQVGYNYQIRQFVIGVEGELYWAGLTNRSEFQPILNAGNFDDLTQASNRYDATIALRVGYAIDRALFYGKLGAVWGKFDFSDTETPLPSCVGCNSFLETGSATIPGLLVGVGFEYAFWDNWSGKIEYNYMNFGDALVGFQDYKNGVPTEQFNETVRQSKQIVKVGVNYLFH